MADPTLFEYIACQDPSMDPDRIGGRCANAAFVWCTLYDDLLCHAHARRHLHKEASHRPVYEATEQLKARATVRLPMLED